MKFNDDATTLAWLRQQQAAIVIATNQNSVNSANVYPYKTLIPVVSTGNPFAQSIIFRSDSGAGVAGWINGNADDVPMADVTADMSVKPIYLAAIGYGYGWDELNQAQRYGVTLTADKASVCRRAYEEFVNRVAFSGDSEKSMLGLINQPNGSVVKATTATDFTDVSTDAKVKLIITAIATAVGNTGGATPSANTLLVSKDVALAWKTAFIGATVTNLYDFIKSSQGANGGAINIAQVDVLKTAASGNKNRVIAYNNDTTALQLHVPMQHRFLPVYQAGPLRWEVPGVFRLAGLNVIRKTDVSYLDSTTA